MKKQHSTFRQVSILNSQFSTSSGFTLIELLVVIGIIAVLITALFTFINPSKQLQRARDAKRKSDLTQIRTAIEDYKADTGLYPISSAFVGTGRPLGWPSASDCDSLINSGNNLSANGKSYLKIIPCDPQGNSSRYNNGLYWYSSDGYAYTIATCLEDNAASGRYIYSSSASIPIPPSTFGASAPVTGDSTTCPSGKYYAYYIK